MISTEVFRKLDDGLTEVPDEELTKIKDSMYELGHLIFDDWLENGRGSKYPVGVLQRFKERNKIKSWLTKDQKQE